MKRKTSIAFLAGVMAMLGTPAGADYRAEYKAYTIALKAGDYPKAAEHGEAAWRQAEQELGESKTTAILAFNYAELVVTRSPERAREAYERAKAMSAKIETGLVPAEIEAGLALCDLALRPDEKSARALEDVLKARRAQGLKASPVSAHGYLMVAQNSRSKRRTRDAADSAIVDADEIGGAAYSAPLLRQALVIAAIVRVTDKPLDAVDVKTAVALFDRAFPLFPPQKSIDAFDPLLATALSYRQSLGAIARSYDIGAPTGIRSVQPNLGRALKEAMADAEDTDDWVRWVPPHTSCKFEGKITIPSYPKDAVSDSRVGAILIGYDVRGTRVERALILADQSGSGFGEATIMAMKDWERDAPAPPECEKDQLIYVSFAIR